jgi:hypothetical protein
MEIQVKRNLMFIKFFTDAMMQWFMNLKFEIVGIGTEITHAEY